MNIDWSRQMYVHGHIKKRAVSGVGGKGWRLGGEGWLDKPLYLGDSGGERRGGERVQGGAEEALGSPLLGHLGGARGCHRPARVHPPVLVLGLLLRWF